MVVSFSKNLYSNLIMLALTSYNFVLKKEMGLKFLPFINLASIFKCAKFQVWDLICPGDIAVCCNKILYVTELRPSPLLLSLFSHMFQSPKRFKMSTGALYILKN